MGLELNYKPEKIRNYPKKYISKFKQKTTSGKSKLKVISNPPK